ncbi:hypothetical protein ACFL6H_04450 [Candidatus Latescibacterota bacterium]
MELKFYNDNKWYCRFLIIISIIIIIGNLFFLLRETPKYVSAGKVWELASCILIILYTSVFWFFSDDGEDLLDSIKPEIKTKTIRRIFWALGMLIGIIALNIWLIFKNNSLVYGKISTGFVVLVFALFCHIDNLIIHNHSDEEKQKEFRYYLSNSDFPSFITFFILFVYSWFIYNSMQLFFSGAIAFQMLISTVAWVKK